MPSVVLDRVSKVFPRPGGQQVHALRDCSLEVADREILVFLGPSGSGKTTALRLIAGLEQSTSGSISIGGRKMDRVPARKRDVAMVFQHHALYPHMTARGNLEFGLKLRRIPRLEIVSRVRETAAMLELDSVLDVFPAHLSGGQRQRVAFGRALIRRPKVLLCDEPFSQLDAPLRAQLRAELLRLRERLAVTIIHVTHDQAEALTLGDRVAVIHDGALQQVDEPMHLYREPKNLLVAGFVGTQPMNLVHGMLTSRNGLLWFQENTPVGEGSFGLPVDPAQAVRLKSCVGKPVVLGMRPENVRSGMLAPHSPASGRIEAVIQLVERTGADMWLHCETTGHRIVARWEAATAGFKAGDRIHLLLDLSNAHYFDPVTQQAIC